ncbi:MAG: peptidase M19, partial [Caldilineaceae bacterium]|nr:peptidase M19 [Caldilineaceae bacterium]
MLIIDGHLDLSMNAIQWNRNLLEATYTIRTTEQYTQGKGRALGTVAFPEMRSGR